MCEHERDDTNIVQQHQSHPREANPAAQSILVVHGSLVAIDQFRLFHAFQGLKDPLLDAVRNLLSEIEQSLADTEDSKGLAERALALAQVTVNRLASQGIHDAVSLEA
jgi:hypothetical protein